MDHIEAYGFDTGINRKGTNSYKWDTAEVFKENLLSLSVADMDFAVPPEVTEALIKRTKKPVYGYEFQPDVLKQAIVAWEQKRHGFDVRKDWLIYTPGVVNGLAVSILALTQKGDRVVIQPPVYPPFFSVVKDNERDLLLNPLHYNTESFHYTMDFNGLEQLFSEQKPRLMFLCNPHNPTGRVWTSEELQALGALCDRYQVILVSDDIHADLVFSGHRYHPLISVSEALKNNAIQLMSPGKSFNIPGLRFSYAVIANRTLRDRFSKKLSALALNKTNIMAAVASQAVYQSGAEWLDSVLKYIWNNNIFLKETFSSELPWAKIIPLEGTFLAWIDLNASGLDHIQLSRVVRSKAKLKLIDGDAFGDAGRGFMRINLACPRKMLQEAVRRLVAALTQAKKNPPSVEIMDKLPLSSGCCSG